MTEPFLSQKTFQQSLSEWSKQAQVIGALNPQFQQQLTTLEQRYTELAPVAAESMKKASRWPLAMIFPGVLLDVKKGITSSRELDQILLDIEGLKTEFDRNLFYSDVFGILPALVQSGAVNSADEALAMVAIPGVITEAELARTRQDIANLISSRNQDTAPPQDMPELAAEGEEFPPLVAPTQGRTLIPTTIHKLTITELLKSFTAQQIPETTMSPDEWNDYLRLKGWDEADIDDQTRITTEQLIAAAINRKNLIESYLSAAPELPAQTVFDMFKMAIINPPMFVLEGLNIYYEHVSMPAAGWLYGQIPDIKKAYEKFKVQFPFASGREARVYAWQQWEAPGPPVLDFILKYMIMEGLVDPTTYLGWGIGTRLLKGLGPMGRAAAAGNHMIGEILELPFDFVKYTTKNIIPKTVSQQAGVYAREGLSILDRYFELATQVPLSFIKPKDMYKAGQQALEHLARNPRAEDNIAMAARQLLIHPPTSEREVTGWLARLKSTGAQVFSPEDLNGEKLLDIDNVFERVFNKEMTVDEAAPQLLHHLGVVAGADITEDVSVLAGRILSDRSNAIFSRALDFATERTANRAMREYGRKSLRIWTATVSAPAVLAAQKSGRFAALLYNIDKSLIHPWLSVVDRTVIRTAAQAYLTFGLYGPMNVLEDVFRSILGGVKPGRVSVEAYDIHTLGLLGDPELRRGGLSEMIGPLRETGEAQRSNWILTMSLAPLSVPTWAATRGRVTPRQFAKNTYTTLVELFGGVGIDVRRNFVVGKYSQLLADAGGDPFRALLEAVPKDFPSILADTPKWVKRNLAKEIRAAVTSGQLTPDNATLIKTMKDRYTKNRIVRAEVNDIIMKYPEISPTSRSLVMDGFDERSLLESPEMIDDFMKNTVLNAEIDDFLRGPERATVQFDDLKNLLTSMEVTKPEDMAELIVSLHRMTATYGALPDQIMARATIKSRGLPINDRRLQFDAEFDRLYNFMDKAGASVDQVVDFIHSNPVGSEAYQSASQRYLDLTTTARKVITEAKTQDVAFRSSYFADATQKDLRDPTFWNSFYATENAHWRDTSVKMARINSQLAAAVSDINVASGLKAPTRPAVVVRGRPLAPADVAKLMQTRGDDLSRMLLDTLIPEGDKNYFTEYVLGLVREGYDEGFDRASIGAVYDQIADSILVDPNSSSWFRIREKQLESMQSDFHDLYNAKLFPPEQKIAVDNYIDEAAHAVDNVMFEGPAQPRIIHSATNRAAAAKGLELKFQGHTGQGRFNTVDDAVSAAYGMGKTPENIVLVESRGAYDLHILGEPGDAITPPTAARVLKTEFADYDQVRQSSLDEANKWYYKEYPDYTNANAIDAAMKALYPFWTYESQRWFWLPRSFLRRPGTLTSWGRWENNTDYGYVHIPGTSIDVNPMRGTIYGPWSTRLMRRDYPEYYDNLEGMGGFVGFFDFISRYGFYPNVIYGATLAQFGGAQPQTGGVLPAAASTPLNALIAAFPDNPLVTFISERIFPEQFRKYLTAKAVDDLGGDGSLIFAKMQTNQDVTPEEEALWTQARTKVAAHSALFEQFGMFRMRSDEQYAVYKAAEAFIEENWGFTPEQQKQIRMRGEKLWDLIGGLDPWESAALRELDFFKYSGSINPVLPSAKQAVLNRVELGWASVADHSEQRLAEILELQESFLIGGPTGKISAEAFLDGVRHLQDVHRQFVADKIKATPEMELEYRVEQFEKYGDAMPVMSPYNELLGLYFSIELEETVDEFGARVVDWDKFWANREMIAQSIPETDRAQWDAFIDRNTAPMMRVWNEVYDTYMKKYYQLWDHTLESYNEDEQRLIREYLFLTKTGQQLERQAAIADMDSEKTGLKLISSFRSDVSKDRIALRYANPHLDAWLYYWGRTTSFQTPQAEEVYGQLAQRTGRQI